VLGVMHGMTATTAVPATAPRIEGEIVEVRSGDELQAWHEVLCEVFGADDRSRHDWQLVHRALGPSGDGSIEELPERLVVGTGAYGQMRADPEAVEQLRQRGVEVESLPTDEAVRRYCELDPHRTAAALHLTC
jgi:Protein of unknown function (DUF498/DUF598)